MSEQGSQITEYRPPHAADNHQDRGIDHAHDEAGDPPLVSKIFENSYRLKKKERSLEPTIN
jgi:hypothetical protein